MQSVAVPGETKSVSFSIANVSKAFALSGSDQGARRRLGHCNSCPNGIW